MMKNILVYLVVAVACITLLDSCLVLRENAKYNFNDGVYTTKRFSNDKVYVLHVDEDTLAVFPVKEYPDSTAIITARRVNYTLCSAVSKTIKCCIPSTSPLLTLTS